MCVKKASRNVVHTMFFFVLLYQDWDSDLFSDWLDRVMLSNCASCKQKYYLQKKNKKKIPFSVKIEN